MQVGFSPQKTGFYNPWREGLQAQSVDIYLQGFPSLAQSVAHQGMKPHLKNVKEGDQIWGYENNYRVRGGQEDAEESLHQQFSVQDGNLSFVQRISSTFHCTTPPFNDFLYEFFTESIVNLRTEYVKEFHYFSNASQQKQLNYVFIKLVYIQGQIGQGQVQGQVLLAKHCGQHRLGGHMTNTNLREKNCHVQN